MMSTHGSSSPAKPSFVNKLTKRPGSTPVRSVTTSNTGSSPVSATFKYALQHHSNSDTAVIQAVGTGTGIARQSPSSYTTDFDSSYASHGTQPVPLTATEQYWAARALKAETLLAARESHKHELKQLSSENEVKRTEELAAIVRTHERRQARLEVVVVSLLTGMFFMFSALIFLLLQQNNRPQPTSSPWLMLPTRLTVPILSPFASVVEHENSTIGSKTIAVFVITSAFLIYGLIRYRGPVTKRLAG